MLTLLSARWRRSAALGDLGDATAVAPPPLSRSGVVSVGASQFVSYHRRPAPRPPVPSPEGLLAEMVPWPVEEAGRGGDAPAHGNGARAATPPLGDAPAGGDPRVATPRPGAPAGVDPHAATPRLAGAPDPDAATPRLAGAPAGAEPHAATPRRSGAAGDPRFAATPATDPLPHADAEDTFAPAAQAAATPPELAATRPPRREPAPPAARAPRPKWPFAVGAVAAVALVAFLATRGGDEPAPAGQAVKASAPSTLAAGPLSVRLPAGWGRRAPDGLGALALDGAAVAGPPGDAGGTVVLGLGAALAHAPPRRARRRRCPRPPPRRSRAG